MISLGAAQNLALRKIMEAMRIYGVPKKMNLDLNRSQI